MKKYVTFIFVLSVVTILLSTAAFAAKSGGIELVTKEELLQMMDNNDPDLLILDVRKGTDWRASEFMIKGAVRLNLNQISSVNYPKDKKLVLY
jgi:hypothetical protein